MNVLLVTQYFYPEVGATQTRMMEFARALVACGHSVDVLTEFPNHPAGVIPPEYRGRWFEVQELEGFRVIRVWVYARPRKTFWTRIAFYGSFVIFAIAARRKLRRRYDCIAATTPPLPVAAAGLALSRLTRAVFVMDVRDLWPLAARALGELSNATAYRWAERLEQYLYDHAARITVTTRAFARHIAASHPEREARLRLIPNGTIGELFDPARGDGGVRVRLGLGADFVVGYAGLHGIAQGLGVVLEAASRLREARVRFLFVGEGPDRSALQEEAARRRLSNVTFVGQVPQEDVAHYLNAADAVVVPLVADPVFQMFVPSKMFDAMACARAVLLMVPGEAREILEEAKAGVFVPPGDAAALAAEIRQLASDPVGAADMGTRGREYVLARYLRKDQGRRFAEVLREAAGIAPDNVTT